MSWEQQVQDYATYHGLSVEAADAWLRQHAQRQDQGVDAAEVLKKQRERSGASARDNGGSADADFETLLAEVAAADSTHQGAHGGEAGGAKPAEFPDTCRTFAGRHQE